MYSQWGTYGFVLAIHSILRWALIAAGFVAVARAWIARARGRVWSSADTVFARVFVIGFDLQLLVGAALYGLFSAVVAGALTNLPLAMQSRAQRFWVLEHPLAMIAALTLAHIGLSKARKTGGTEGQRTASIFFTMAFLVLLAAIPWPIFTFGRLLWPLP